MSIIVCTVYITVAWLILHNNILLLLLYMQFKHPQSTLVSRTTWDRCHTMISYLVKFLPSVSSTDYNMKCQFTDSDIALAMEKQLNITLL